MTIFAPPAWAQSGSVQEVGRHRAHIVKVKGDVQVKPVGDSRWVAARANREVRTGDKVRTGPDGQARVRVGDMGEVVLRPGSEATVGNLRQVKTTASAFFFLKKKVIRDDVELELNKGDLRAGYNRNEGRVGNYNVFTPVAVAGVRGTKFALDLDGQKPWWETMDEGKGQGGEESLTTMVFEGMVAMSGPNWERSVRAGQQLKMVSGQVPGLVTQADLEKLQEIGSDFADIDPPAFGGVTAVERLTSATVQTSWNAASDNSTPASEIVYDIYVANSSRAQDFSSPTVTTAPGVTSLVLNDLTDDNDHFIVVRARDAAGNRDQNTKEFSTSATDQTPPDFSGISTIERLNPTTVQVTWQAASDNESAQSDLVYDIYLATSSGAQDFTTSTATTDPGATSTEIANLSEESEYYAVVRARDEEGNADDNTREATTFRDDETSPEFSGAIRGREISPGQIRVTWNSATDNQTDAENIVYEIYLSDESTRQNFMGEPIATSNPGAVSHQVTINEFDLAPRYFVVVRARDEAGNTDENIQEIEIVSPSYVKTEVGKLTQELFDAYETKNAATFMEFISSSFSGANSEGNALTYATLREALSSDFKLLSSIQFDPSISSVSTGGAGQAVAEITWSATFTFAESGNTKTSVGKTMRLTWDHSENPMKVITWEGSVPFGVTEPLTEEVLTDVVFDLQEVQGPTSFSITGDYTDFAPLQFTARGSGFEQGAVVEIFEDDPAFTGWVELGAEVDHAATQTYVSSSEIRADFTSFQEKWRPTDRNGSPFPNPVTHTINLRVVNPSGELSNIVSKDITISAGPLRFVEFREFNPGFGNQITNLGGGHEFGIQAYNIVRPVDVVIADRGNTTMSPDWRNMEVLGVNGSSQQSSGGNDLTPNLIRIRAEFVGAPTQKASYDIIVTDGRGQSFVTTVPVTDPPPPNLTFISGPTDFTIMGDYTDFAPMSFTFDGENFMPDAVVEIFEDDFQAWVDVTQGDIDWAAFLTRDGPNRLTLNVTRDVECWDIQRTTHPENDVARFHVKNPDGQISPELTLGLNFTAGPLNMTKAFVTNTATGKITNEPIRHDFHVEGYNFVQPFNIIISDAVSPGTPSNLWTAPYNVNLFGGGSTCADPQAFNFSADFIGAPIHPVDDFIVMVTDDRVQSASLNIITEPVIPMISGVNVPTQLTISTMTNEDFAASFWSMTTLFGSDLQPPNSFPENQLQISKDGFTWYDMTTGLGAPAYLQAGSENPLGATQVDYPMMTAKFKYEDAGTGADFRDFDFRALNPGPAFSTDNGPPFSTSVEILPGPINPEVATLSPNTVMISSDTAVGTPVTFSISVWNFITAGGTIVDPLNVEFLPDPDVTSFDVFIVNVFPYDPFTPPMIEINMMIMGKVIAASETRYLRFQNPSGASVDVAYTVTN